MSRSLNRVMLIGNLTKDAEVRFVSSGVSVASFSVATSRRWKDKQSNEWKEDVSFHNVQLWRSENLANYLLKGKQVYVEGRLQTRSYDKDGEKRYVTEVVADEVILLGGGSKGDEAPAPRPAAAMKGFAEPIDDSDVPF
jgi:single-strand DNA-binding protein